MPILPTIKRDPSDIHTILKTSMILEIMEDEDVISLPMSQQRELSVLIGCPKCRSHSISGHGVTTYVQSNQRARSMCEHCGTTFSLQRPSKIAKKHHNFLCGHPALHHKAGLCASCYKKLYTPENKLTIERFVEKWRSLKTEISEERRTEKQNRLSELHADADVLDMAEV